MSQSSGSSHHAKAFADTIRRQVIEYLIKKGYNRTEQTLRQESANLDRDGKPIHDRVEDVGNAKYSKAFTLLSNWIDQNLDIYKVSIFFNDEPPR
jgi:transcription initiation factor TFIID subunit 5